MCWDSYHQLFTSYALGRYNYDEYQDLEESIGVHA